jgi:hypothetical protein
MRVLTMKFWLFIVVILLSSCASVILSEDIKRKLSSVEIGQVNSAEEAECYYYLQKFLDSSIGADYLLNFTLDYSEDKLAMSKSSYVTRKSLTQIIKFELQKKETQAVLLKDTIRLYSSYSLNTEPLISYAQMDSNKKFLARRAAEVLRYRLINFFHKERQRETSRQSLLKSTNQSLTIPG